MERLASGLSNPAECGFEYILSREGEGGSSVDSMFAVMVQLQGYYMIDGCLFCSETFLLAKMRRTDFGLIPDRAAAGLISEFSCGYSLKSWSFFRLCKI